MIQLKRVYDPPSKHDGLRFLVERLWPRGVRKEDLTIHAWQKEAGPSNELRKWFAHDPKRWEKFKEKYFSELDSHPRSWEPLIQAAQRHTITLIFSSHELEHNNAVALKEYLDRKLVHTHHGAVG
jgi:uncharacterized protein YeaO (DUF488 family)